MIAKTEKQKEAIELRKLKMSYKDIARTLGVSISSVSLWLNRYMPKDEEAELKSKLREKASKNYNGKQSKRATDLRQKWQNDGRLKAKEFDPLHIQGCMLYWAEGGKSRNQLSFCNGDVNMVRTFVKFLRECYGEYIQSVSLRINFYSGNGLTQDEIENFWMSELQLDRTSLRRSTVDYFPSEKHGKRKGKLPYGVARIEVSNTELLQNIYGSIQEYCGFSNPSWVL